eukprot:TRINITY_DN35206_c0_g1_i1.p1 TRINITY_DN35206_c0_g1~~TRINITY_DN35206_c0_g1_i1.p1  ORF type:complete len:136 (+),score=15.76 TRINITY_DN35206_c0_g1_i1:66-473(+)
MCPPMSGEAPADTNKEVVLMNTNGSGHLNPMLALSEALVRAEFRVHFFAPRAVQAQIAGTGATWCHYGTEDWDLFAAMKRVVDRLEVEPDKECFEKMMPYAVIPATLDVLPISSGAWPRSGRSSSCSTVPSPGAG